MYYYSTSAATRSRTSAYCQRNISEAPDADLTFLTAINSGRQSGGPKDPRPEVSNPGFIFHVPPGYSRALPHQDPKASGPSSDHAKRHPRRLGPRRHVGTAPDSEQVVLYFYFHVVSFRVNFAPSLFPLALVFRKGNMYHCITHVRMPS